MTRFKEMRRINAAIAHGDRTELEWALWYCEVRVRIATMKHHEKHWRDIERDVRAAIKNAEQRDGMKGEGT